jgi:Protein of unknown function (DUF2808)
MSQIQEVLALVIVSTLLGASTTTAKSDNSILSNANVVSSKQDVATVDEDTYSFTMTLPERTSNRFAKLSFSLTKPDQYNEVAPIYLNLMATTAFAGKSNAMGEGIGVKRAWIDETGTVWVEFTRSLDPDTTLTVVFKTQKPLSEGLYQYSIAAYPDTKKSVAVFVGNGMLAIK